MKTQQAILFRFNNKNIQVNFVDKTALLLHQDNNMVYYADAEGNQSSYVLKHVLESGNKALIKRLKYTREIQQQLLQN